MNASLLVAASDPNPWVGPAIVAAAVSGLVALVTVALSSRQVRKDRQRQLFADAFAACQAYKEFPYRVRRRRSDKDDEAAADRTRLTTELSDVQSKLNDFKARLRVEAPRVGHAYAALVAATRRIAGGEVSRSWSLPPTEGDAVSVTDIDLSGLGPTEDQYVLVVADHLSTWPSPAARLGRSARRRLQGRAKPGTSEPTPAT